MNDVYKAIADPTRRQILLMIAEKPVHINVISDHFEISRPAVSKHIKILQESQLISIKSNDNDGRKRLCYAQLDAMHEVKSYIQTLEEFWENRLDKLGILLDNSSE